DRARLDHLPIASTRTRRHRIPRNVSAGGAPAGVRARSDAGLADYPDPDLRNAVVDGVGVFHGADAAWGPDIGRVSAADRQEPRRMRPGLPGIVGLPDAYRDTSPAATGDNCSVAVGVHCQRQRAWRIDFPGRQQRQGHRTLDYRRVAEFIATLSSALALIQ